MEDMLDMKMLDLMYDLLNRVEPEVKELELRVWKDEERLELMKVDLIC